MRLPFAVNGESKEIEISQDTFQRLNKFVFLEYEESPLEYVLVQIFNHYRQISEALIIAYLETNGY